MPGRGTPWRVGGHRDETIELEDLTQALQAQITGGGGGGNVEVILDATVPSNLVSHTLAFTRSPALDGTDVGLIKIIISEITLSVADVVNIGFNGDVTGMTSKGVSSNGTTVTAVQEIPITDGVTMSTGNGGSIIIEIPGDLFSAGGSTGCFAKFSDTSHYSNVAFNLQSSAFNPLVSITIKSKGGIATVNTPTRIVAYAFNKD